MKPGAEPPTPSSGRDPCDVADGGWSFVSASPERLDASRGDSGRLKTFVACRSRDVDGSRTSTPPSPLPVSLTVGSSGRSSSCRWAGADRPPARACQRSGAIHRRGASPRRPQTSTRRAWAGLDRPTGLVRGSTRCRVGSVARGGTARKRTRDEHARPPRGPLEPRAEATGIGSRRCRNPLWTTRTRGSCLAYTPMIFAFIAANSSGVRRPCSLHLGELLEFGELILCPRRCRGRRWRRGRRLFLRIPRRLPSGHPAGDGRRSTCDHRCPGDTAHEPRSTPPHHRPLPLLSACPRTLTPACRRSRAQPG